MYRLFLTNFCAGLADQTVGLSNPALLCFKGIDSIGRAYLLAFSAGDAHGLIDHHAFFSRPRRKAKDCAVRTDRIMPERFLKKDHYEEGKARY